MPSRQWPLWLLALSVPFGLPVVSFIYWPQVLRAGVLPPESDNIGIPMFGSILGAIVLFPIILIVTYFCVRRYNPATRFFAWRRDKAVRSWAATIIFGGAALCLLLSEILELSRAPAWYEFLWTPYFLLWAVWFMALRASTIEQLPSDGG